MGYWRIIEARDGTEYYYGSVRIIDPRDGRRRQVERKLGARRKAGAKEGLTARQRDELLRQLPERLIEELTPKAVEVTRDDTLADIHPLVMAEVRAKGRSHTTTHDYQGYLRHYVRFFSDRPVRAITKRDVEAFRDHQLTLPGRTRDTLAPSTVRNQLAFLHSLFAYAEGEGIVTTNPVKHVAKPQDARVEMEEDDDGDFIHLEEHEVEALLAAAADDYLGPTDRVLWMTAVLTGLRQGELRALRWRHIDFEASKLRVRRSISRGQEKTPKSKMSRREVPLDPRLTLALKEHKVRSRFSGEDDRVFANPHARAAGNAYDDAKMRTRFYDALKRSGMPPARIGRRGGVSFHSLRHTYGTMMGRHTPIRRLQEWMGHEDITTTQRYMGKARVEDSDLAYVARAFSSL